MQDKAEASAAIARAQSELDVALAHLSALSPVDADRLAYAAHALNNYLMVVATIGRVLRVRLGAAANAEALDRFAALDHATVLMKQLVRQLVIPEGDERPRLIFMPTDLAQIMRAGFIEYEPIAAAKNISIEREVPHQPVTVWSDKVAIGVVVDNLLSNAVKYSVPGGTIRLRTYIADGEGICAITDAGPGIAEADAPHLFQRGRKLSARPTAGESSTGYGLAIARDLMDALGGRIWFHNEPAGGATFSFALRLHDPATDFERRL